MVENPKVGEWYHCMHPTKGVQVSVQIESVTPPGNVGWSGTKPNRPGLVSELATSFTGVLPGPQFNVKSADGGRWIAGADELYKIGS